MKITKDSSPIKSIEVETSMYQKTGGHFIINFKDGVSEEANNKLYNLFLELPDLEFGGGATKFYSYCMDLFGSLISKLRAQEYISQDDLVQLNLLIPNIESNIALSAKVYPGTSYAQREVLQTAAYVPITNIIKYSKTSDEAIALFTRSLSTVESDCLQSCQELCSHLDITQITELTENLAELHAIFVGKAGIEQKLEKKSYGNIPTLEKQREDIADYFFKKVKKNFNGFNEVQEFYSKLIKEFIKLGKPISIVINADSVALKRGDESIISKPYQATEPDTLSKTSRISYKELEAVQNLLSSSGLRYLPLSLQDLDHQKSTAPSLQEKYSLSDIQMQAISILVKMKKNFEDQDFPLRDSAIYTVNQVYDAIIGKIPVDGHVLASAAHLDFKRITITRAVLEKGYDYSDTENYKIIEKTNPEAYSLIEALKTPTKYPEVLARYKIRGAGLDEKKAAHAIWLENSRDPQKMEGSIIKVSMWAKKNKPNFSEEDLNKALSQYNLNK